MRKNYFFLLLVTFLGSNLLNSQVKITQVYGGGGNSGATIKHDFIQLKNTSTTTSINISAWSVQYASATGTTWNKTDIPALTPPLAPGQYFLIRQGAGAGGTDLSPVDLTPTIPINMSGASGKVALVNNTTLLTGAQPTGTTIEDMVGYGVLTAANQVEGPSTGTALTATTTAQRKNNGCVDNNNNFNDFIIAPAAAPIKSSTTIEICSTDPSISITSPANGVVLSPEALNVDIVLSIDNFIVAPAGMGNGWIKFSLNGGTFTDKFDILPINIGLISGTNTVTVKLVDNVGADLIPMRSATVTFNKATYTVATDLAALRADVNVNGIGKYYQVSSAPVTTFTRPSGQRNQKYIQDASAAILIDDASGILNSVAITENQAVSNLKVVTNFFNGVLQAVPTTATGVTASTVTPVSPANVSIANLDSNPVGFRESELINLGNVTFTLNVGAPFAANTNYVLNQGGAETITFRTLFGEADYISPTPANVPGSADMIALVSRNAATKQIVVRRLADISNLSASKFSQIDGLKMYPNPAKNVLYIETAINNEVSVNIFDVLGKQVLNSKVNNNIVNIQSLNTGIYVVKITENDVTATQKLIVE